MVLSAFLLMLSAPTAVLATPAPPEKLFSTPEKQVFSLKFIDTTAGEMELETLPSTEWQSRPAHHFRATVKTVGLFRWIYPFSQVADIYFDRERAIPLFVDVSLNDRTKTQRTRITLDSKKLRGEELEESKEENGAANFRRKSWAIPVGAQSIFSVLHYLRLQKLVVGQTITFPVAHDEKNGTLQADVLKAEMVKVPKGERRALMVRIRREFVTKFRNSIQNEPVLWLTDDDQKKLLRMEFVHRRGKVIAILKTPLT